jgi:Kef-type K+ transport system membrane component KefB
MTAIALLLAAAAAAHVLARWLALPTVPLLMLAGAAVVVAAPVPAEFLELTPWSWA